MKTLEFPQVIIDLEGERLWREERVVPLRPKPWQLLRYLIEHPQRLITKAELLDAVWGDVEVTEASLSVAIADLRRALGDDSRKPRFIETVHRRGVRFIAQPRGPRAPLGSGGSERALLVGRERELAWLEERLQRAHAGRRQIVFVTGEAGIGKTSLIRTFLEGRADDPPSEPLWIARGQCVEHYGQGDAFVPALELLEGLAHGPGSEALQGALERFAPSWLLQLPGLQRPAGNRDSPRATAQSMLRELCLAVEALGEKRTLVLWLEDMHWSDLSSVDLLAMLARRSTAARLLVLATFRPVDAAMNAHPIRELKSSLLQHGACDQLNLELLAESALRDYLSARFSADPQPTIAPLIHELTDGNPLCAVTLVNQLVAEEKLRLEGETLTLTISPEAFRAEGPNGLKSLVEAQLFGMSTEEVRVLEAASVVGTSFAAQALAAAVGTEPEAVEVVCGRLAEWRRFIETTEPVRWPDGSTGQGYAFLHDAFRTVLYRRVAGGRRQGLHRRVGMRLEAGFEGQTDRIAPELAVHFERGGDPDRAVVFLAQAAASVSRRFSEQAAVGYLQRALELMATQPDSEERAGRELELRLQLARATLLAVGYAADTQDANVERARELSERLGDPTALAVVLSWRARVELVRGNLARTKLLGEEQLALEPVSGDPILASQSHLQLAHSYFYQGALDRAEREFGQVRSLLDELDSGEPIARLGHDPLVYALANSGWTSWLRGHPTDARRRAEAALARAEAVGDPLSAAAALMLAGVVSMFLRDPLGGAALVERLAETLKQYGVRLPYAHRFAIEGWITAQTESAAAGIARLREGIAATGEAESRLASSLLFATLAEAELGRGAAGEGLAAIDEALTFVEKSGERFWEAEIHRLKGELLLLSETPAPAEACFQTALDRARRQGARALELRAATSLARFWKASSRKDQARALLSPVYTGFGEGFETRDLKDAKALLDAL